MHNRLHNRLHGAWLHMHSLPQAELCLKKLLPSDNLINQLSVISLNHWRPRQIAFLSSSLGLQERKKNWRGLFDYTDAFICCRRIPHFQSNKYVLLSLCEWCVHVCIWYQAPVNSALSVYTIIKPNHPTCFKPQHTLPVVDLKRNRLLLLQSRYIQLQRKLHHPPESTRFSWNAILKSLLIVLIISPFGEVLKCENEEVGACLVLLETPKWGSVGLNETVLLLFHWGCSLIGCAALIQNNDNVHHPVASGNDSCSQYNVCVCLYVHVSACACVYC